jgi:hypothetical protein
LPDHPRREKEHQNLSAISHRQHTISGPATREHDFDRHLIIGVESLALRRTINEKLEQWAKYCDGPTSTKQQQR